MRAVLAFLVLVLTTTTLQADLSVERSPKNVAIKGGHFALTIDLTQGGRISSLKLHDGAGWHDVFAAPAIGFPMFVLSDRSNDYALANDGTAELIDLTAGTEKVAVKVRAVPRTSDGRPSPWKIDLGYEIHPEGAVFIDLDCRLEKGEFALSRADLSFTVDEAIRKAPQFRDQNVSIKTGGFRSARAAFGMSEDPTKSFTNEIEVIVEHKQAMAGQVAREQKDGRVTWSLGGGAELKAPYRYRNRFALGLGAAVGGKPKSNVVAQRVYHWVNWLDTTDWYPTDEQIDRMVANHATMLILHHEYLLQRGTNGYPHADYGVARNHREMVRTIDTAHKKGLRVGLYMRGVEMYALKTGFFQKYCKRDWDGIYADWHGPSAVSWHDNRYSPEPKLGDTHFSEKGTHVPARAYFLFTRKLREMVGPKGFLIGHQGSFNAGVFSNLCFDAYLPGETGSDRKIFSNLDEATYKGMLGGGVCMPWMLDLPLYRNAEGAAKLAAWGFYPHIVLGIKSRHTKKLVFSLDPDDAQYDYMEPYWRVLASIDAEKATVYNLSSQNVAAMRSSEPGVQGVVYKAGEGTVLAIVANLGAKTVGATLTLDTNVLGMAGEYEVRRIDAATGQAHPHGRSTGVVATSQLPQWGIEGLLFRKR